MAKTKTKKRGATRRRVTKRFKRDKIETVMHEFKHRQLHSGSKRGPLVRSRRQAIAIALSEQRHADERRKKWRLAKAKRRAGK
jgi:hypothetical protein